MTGLVATREHRFRARRLAGRDGRVARLGAQRGFVAAPHHRGFAAFLLADDLGQQAFALLELCGAFARREGARHARFSGSCPRNGSSAARSVAASPGALLGRQNIQQQRHLLPVDQRQLLAPDVAQLQQALCARRGSDRRECRFRRAWELYRYQSQFTLHSLLLRNRKRFFSSLFLHQPVEPVGPLPAGEVAGRFKRRVRFHAPYARFSLAARRFGLLRACAAGDRLWRFGDKRRAIPGGPDSGLPPRNTP